MYKVGEEKLKVQLLCTLPCLANATRHHRGVCVCVYIYSLTGKVWRKECQVWAYSCGIIFFFNLLSTDIK